MIMTLVYWIDEYMVFCRSNQLREKTLNSYEQALRLFERWCKEAMNIDDVGKITEAVIRRYINELQERGKYTFGMMSAFEKEAYAVSRCSCRPSRFCVRCDKYRMTRVVRLG